MSGSTHRIALGQEPAETHRQAYNAAFEELGLNWHWDRVTFACLPASGRDGVREYIEREQPHLLRAYEAEFLVDAIETAKARCHEVMMRGRARAPWCPPPQPPAYGERAR